MRPYLMFSAIFATALAIGGLSVESSSKASVNLEGLGFSNAQTHLPATVAPVLERACRDCHSNQTVWPWYSHIPPVSLMIEHDVNAGRAKFNFSPWVSGSVTPTRNQMAEICDAVSDGSMPPKGYRLMHREARLSEADVNTLCQWPESANVQTGMNSAAK
jgi:Haem-binding domain